MPITNVALEVTASNENGTQMSKNSSKTKGVGKIRSSKNNDQSIFGFFNEIIIIFFFWATNKSFLQLLYMFLKNKKN